MRPVILTLAVLSAAVVSACGGGYDPDTPVADDPQGAWEYLDDDSRAMLCEDYLADPTGWDGTPFGDILPAECG